MKYIKTDCIQGIIPSNINKKRSHCITTQIKGSSNTHNVRRGRIFNKY